MLFLSRIFLTLLAALSLIGADVARAGPVINPFALATSAPAWTTVRGPITLNSNSFSWGGFTLRERIFAASLTDVSGSQIRLTIQAPTSLQTLRITKIYIGVKGAGTHDFASAPTQLFFGGSASVTAGTGASVTTDAATFAYDGTGDLVMSIYVSSGAGVGFNSVTSSANSTAVNKSGDDATTLVASGYSSGSANDFISLFEALV